MLSHHRVETPRGHNGLVLDRRCQGPGHSQGQSNSHGTQNAGLKVESAALHFFFSPFIGLAVAAGRISSAIVSLNRHPVSLSWLGQSNLRLRFSPFQNRTD